MNRIVVQPDPRRKRVQVTVTWPGAERVALEVPEANLRAEGPPGVHFLTFTEFTPWTPSTPLLYTLRATIDDAVTELKFGMREVSVQEQRFTVNQRPYMLRGVRNAAQGLTDPAAVRAYLEALKKAGVTWVKCVAGDDGLDDLLDAADLTGLLTSVVVEHSRNIGEIAPIIHRLHHHPSILNWEMTDSDDVAVALREADPLRPILVCSERPDRCWVFRPFQTKPEGFAPLDVETFSPVSRETESFFAHLGHASALNLVVVRGLAPSTAPELNAHQADGVRLCAEHLRANLRLAGYCFEDAVSADTKTCAPQLAALREAQAAVRPVISLARSNLVPREEIEVSVLLLNEAKLEGRAEMSLQVVGPTNQTLWKKKRGVKLPKHGKELWTGTVAASGSTGLHRFVVQIWTDQGLAGEGSAAFHVSPPVEAWKSAVDVLDGPGNRWLDMVQKLAPRIEPMAPVILVPPLARSVRAYPDSGLGQLLGRVREGAVAIVFDPPADWQALAATLSAPLEAATDSLLHAKHAGAAVMARLHPVFEGLPAGGTAGRPYRGTLTRRYVVGESEDDIAPVSVWSGTADPGAMVMVRRFGNGRVIFTTLRLLERLGHDPVAERLFTNLLRYSERRALPFAGIARAEMKAVEWLRAERGKLRAWRVIGPFPNPDGTGHAAVYPPEAGFDPEATFAGSFRAVSWNTWHQDGILVEEVNLAEALAPGTFAASPLAGTYYAYAEVTAEGRTELNLTVRHSGAAKVWVNGRVAYESSPTSVLADTGGEHGGGVVLKLGRNTVLVKVSVLSAKPWFALDLGSDDVAPQWR